MEVQASVLAPAHQQPSQRAPAPSTAPKPADKKPFRADDSDLVAYIQETDRAKYASQPLRVVQFTPFLPTIPTKTLIHLCLLIFAFYIFIFSVFVVAAFDLIVQCKTNTYSISYFVVLSCFIHQYSVDFMSVSGSHSSLATSCLNACFGFHLYDFVSLAFELQQNLTLFILTNIHMLAEQMLAFTNTSAPPLVLSVCRVVRLMTNFDHMYEVHYKH